MRELLDGLDASAFDQPPSSVDRLPSPSKLQDSDAVRRVASLSTADAPVASSIVEGAEDSIGSGQSPMRNIAPLSSGRAALDTRTIASSSPAPAPSGQLEDDLAAAAEMLLDDLESDTWLRDLELSPRRGKPTLEAKAGPSRSLGNDTLGCTGARKTAKAKPQQGTERADPRNTLRGSGDDGDGWARVHDTRQGLGPREAAVEVSALYIPPFRHACLHAAGMTTEHGVLTADHWA